MRSRQNPAVIFLAFNFQFVQYAAHLLGSVGAITADEWPEYRDKGYAMNAKVGKEGIELAFEE